MDEPPPSPSDPADTRLSALEMRVSQLEAILAIYRTLASYGPAADSDSRDLCGDLFTEDSWWEVGQPVWAGGTVMEGPEGVQGMMGDTLHQYYLSNGCAHLVAPPRVTLIDEDTAAVITYQHVVDHVDDGFRIARSTAHKFEMKRCADGRWRIHRRVSRPLQGSEDSKELLRTALKEAPW